MTSFQKSRSLDFETGWHFNGILRKDSHPRALGPIDRQEVPAIEDILHAVGPLPWLHSALRNGISTPMTVKAKKAAILVYPEIVIYITYPKKKVKYFLTPSPPASPHQDSRKRVGFI
jgi:hypothetical protein